ncbi:MAG TPA: tripartite tricarboxylate transporter substrate-binding protein, partial [Vicinamibacterales bacterium]|nr:tripartite tricarboxylate transporter substrate-binding protein [Vicinamibacterales bacterium]
MNRTVGALVSAAVAAAFSSSAAAQTFPTKPIRLVVPFAPGGATDTFSRTLAAELTQTLGQTVLVENRPGAGTIIGAEVVAKAPPDGYTLLFTDLSTHTITGSLYAKLPYDPLKSFVPVTAANSSPLLLVVHPSVGARSVKELIAIAKRQPNIPCGNSGIGTVTHMTAEKFRMRTNISVTPVSYKGGATPVIALLGGEIAMLFATVPASIEHVKKKKLVALGVSADKRSPFLPDIPAIGETVKGVEGAVISGVLAPAGTPRAIVERLHAEFAKVSDAPKVKEIYATNAAETLNTAPGPLLQAMERDARIWAQVVKAAGVKM